MLAKNQDLWIPQDPHNKHWNNRKLSCKPFGQITAVILVSVFCLQTAFLLLEATLKGLNGSISYYDDLMLSASNFILAREVVATDQSIPQRIFLLTIIALYLAVILSVIIILLIKWFQKYKIYNWVQKYNRNLLYIHFYCLALPVYNIVTERIYQAFPVSDARQWTLLIIALLASIVDLMGCFMLFYGAINTNLADPFAIISDHFLKFTCIQRPFMCLANLLVFQHQVIHISSVAINFIYLALTIAHVFLFFYTLPFRNKAIFNVFLFATGTSFLFAISNVVQNMKESYKAPGVFTILMTLILISICVKIARSWITVKVNKTLIDVLEFRLFGEKKQQHMNRYWFLQGIFDLRSTLEFEFASDIVPLIYPANMLKKLGLLKQWLGLEFPGIDFSSENMLKKTIIMIMNTWRKMFPLDCLVSILLAELMVDEFNLIYEPYPILQEILKNNVKTNFKLRAREIQDKIQKSLYSNTIKQNNQLDLATFFEAFQVGAGLKSQIASQIQESLQFYQILQDNNINIVSIMNSGKKVQILKNSVLQCWNRIPRQLQESNNILLLIYGLYKLFLDFEDKEGKELLDLYHRVSKKKASLIEKSEIDNETLSSSDNVTVFISTEKTDMGNIVYCSKNVQNILGRKSKGLVGQNIKIIMPPFFQDIHNYFIQRKLTTSENLLETIHTQQFALDDKGFVIPVNIVVTIYPSITKGFLFAGIIRRVQTRAKYMLLDDQGNISAYSKALLLKLNLPHPDFEQKINILDICGSSDTFEKLVIEPNRTEDQPLKTNTESVDQFIPSEPVDFRSSKILKNNNMYARIPTELISPSFRSTTNCDPIRKGDLLLIKKVLIERELINLCEYKHDLKTSNHPRKLRLQTSKNYSRESSSETSPSRQRFETVQPSQYSSLKKQIQFYCTVSINTFGDRTLKILVLDEVIVALEDNVNFQQKILSPKKEPIMKSQKKNGGAQSAFSGFYRAAVTPTAKLASHTSEDSNDVLDEIDVLDENQSGIQTASLVRPFFIEGQKSIKSPEENTNSEIYLMSKLSEPNFVPASSHRRLIKETSSEMALSSNFHLFQQEPALYSDEGITRDFQINLNSAQKQREGSERKESLVLETTERAFADSKKITQEIANSSVRADGKLEHIDLKLVISKLPIRRFSEIRIAFLSVAVSLAALLAASIFAYNFAVNTLPVIQESFTALRNSLDRIIWLADINYSLSALNFYVLSVATNPSSFLAYQKELNTKLQNFNNVNAQLIQQIDLFSQNYLDFIYEKSIKLYLSDFGNYTSTTNFVYMDTIQSLNVISNHANQVAILPTSQATLIKSHITFLLYNMFNSLLLQLQAQPTMITNQINGFTQSVTTVTDLALIVIPCLFGVTIIMMIMLYIKSYIDIRNFLQLFANFQPHHIQKIIQNINWLKDLIDLNAQEDSVNKRFLRADQNINNANNLRLNRDKNIKTKGLKVEILRKLPLIILILVMPIIIVIPSQKTFASNFESITPTLSNVIQPKKVIGLTLLLVTQTGVFSSNANYRIYDYNASPVIDASTNIIDNLLTEAQMPTTDENYVLLHGDFCQYVDSTRYNSCKLLFNGASNTGIVGAISSVLSFLKYFKRSIDAHNNTALSKIISSGNIRNSYNLTMLAREAIDYIENQRTQELKEQFNVIEESNTTFIILSLIVSLISCVIGIAYVYFPSKKQRKTISQLLLFFPISAIFANHRLKLYLKKNSSLSTTTKRSFMN